MRVSRFGVAVLLLASLYCVFVGKRLTRIPEPPELDFHGPPSSVNTVKFDLCELASAEREFYETTGAYATDAELHANGDDSLPPSGRWPYRYLVEVPTPDAFTIVAMHYGPLNDAPAAVVTDASGQVCIVTPIRARTSRLDPLQRSDAGLIYGCEVCGR